MRHPVDYAPSQDYGENPTRNLPASHWIIKQFGNYQPDGHTGTDYPCPSGTPVRAVADGVVLHVGRLTGSYADNPWWIAPSFAGYVAVIDHGHFIGIYGHCLDGSAGVRAGDRVAEGDVFIRSGNTGASTGDHLHFECLPNGYVLNSYMYGRINPATLFGGISPQGSTTPIEEDDLSDAQYNELSRKLDAIIDDANRSRGVSDAIEDDNIRARIVSIDQRTALLVKDIAYVKRSDEDTLYERMPDNTLRGIGWTEWQSSGKPYVTYQPAEFDEIFKKEG